MAAKVKVDFVVAIGYESGDYAKLCGNGGSGAVDYNTPLSSDRYELFPNGSGIYGFGRAPFAVNRFGFGHSMRTAGFGDLPFGRNPFGYGSVWIIAATIVTACGDYKYGFACYDEAGNLHAGTPEEITVTVHIAPAAPSGLTKTSYNKTTGDLVLAA